MGLAENQGERLVELADTYGQSDADVAAHLHAALVAEANVLLQSKERIAPIQAKAEKAARAWQEMMGSDDSPGIYPRELAALEHKRGACHDQNLRMDTALNELEELRDCTFWKHWCKEAKKGERFFLHDLQNARVEVIDMLFFWISLAQCLGLDADDCLRLYEQKWKVNWNRQDNDYSMADKTEDDNKGIT